MNSYDAYSVKTTSAFFCSEGYSVSATPYQYDHLDLLIENDKGIVGVEVKGRTFPSYQYGDIMVEQTKLDSANEDIANGRCRAVWLASLYTDDVLCLGNIRNGKKVVKNAPKTTCFGNNNIVEKEFISCPQQLKVQVIHTGDGYKFKR